MKRLFSSILFNNKPPKRRDFIAENIRPTKSTNDQNTHSEAGHSIRHDSSSDEITEQKQPLELEAKDASYANNTTKDFHGYSKLYFERQENFDFQNSTKLEDAFSDNINWEYKRQKLIHLMGIFRLRRLIKNFSILFK